MEPYRIYDEAVTTDGIELYRFGVSAVEVGSDRLVALPDHNLGGLNFRRAFDVTDPHYQERVLRLWGGMMRVFRVSASQAEEHSLGWL